MLKVKHKLMNMQNDAYHWKKNTNIKTQKYNSNSSSSKHSSLLESESSSSSEDLV